MVTSDSSTPDAADAGPHRLGWPDVAVLVVVIGFVIFLMFRGLTAQAATITALYTVAAVLGLLLLPRRIGEVMQLLRTISRSVSGSGRGGMQP
jgi:hypothetical protein